MDRIFDINKVDDGYGELLKIFPEPGRADHPIGDYPGHKDVIKNINGKIIKFRIPYLQE